MWSALARHIARRSTTQDRFMLARIAENPRSATAYLNRGKYWLHPDRIHYIVRGDVALGCGKRLTIDELTDAIGAPRLPYLEDMPDELIIDWDGP